MCAFFIRCETHLKPPVVNPCNLESLRSPTPTTRMISKSSRIEAGKHAGIAHCVDGSEIRRSPPGICITPVVNNGRTMDNQYTYQQVSRISESSTVSQYITVSSVLQPSTTAKLRDDVSMNFRTFLMKTGLEYRLTMSLLAWAPINLGWSRNRVKNHLKIRHQDICDPKVVPQTSNNQRKMNEKGRK